MKFYLRSLALLALIGGGYALTAATAEYRELKAVDREMYPEVEPNDFDDLVRATPRPTTGPASRPWGGAGRGDV